MVSKFLIQAWLVCVFTVASYADADVFTGKTVGCDYLFAGQGTDFFNPRPVAVGAGVELSGLSRRGIDVGTLGISDTSIFIAECNISGVWTNTSFSGFQVIDTDNTLGDLTSVAANRAAKIGVFGKSKISFDANSIYVNWQWLAFDEYMVVSLVVNGVNDVQEPASIADWGLVAFGSVFAFRCKKKVAAEPR